MLLVGGSLVVIIDVLFLHSLLCLPSILVSFLGWIGRCCFKKRGESDKAAGISSSDSTDTAYWRLLYATLLHGKDSLASIQGGSTISTASTLVPSERSSASTLVRSERSSASTLVRSERSSASTLVRSERSSASTLVRPEEERTSYIQQNRDMSVSSDIDLQPVGRSNSIHKQPDALDPFRHHWAIFTVFYLSQVWSRWSTGYTAIWLSLTTRVWAATAGIGIIVLMGQTIILSTFFYDQPEVHINPRFSCTGPYNAVMYITTFAYPFMILFYLWAVLLWWQRPVGLSSTTLEHTVTPQRPHTKRQACFLGFGTFILSTVLYIPILVWVGFLWFISPLPRLSETGGGVVYGTTVTVVVIAVVQMCTWGVVRRRASTLMTNVSLLLQKTKLTPDNSATALDTMSVTCRKLLRSLVTDEAGHSSRESSDKASHSSRESWYLALKATLGQTSESDMLQSPTREEWRAMISFFRSPSHTNIVTDACAIVNTALEQAAATRALCTRVHMHATMIMAQQLWFPFYVTHAMDDPMMAHESGSHYLFHYKRPKDKLMGKLEGVPGSVKKWTDHEPSTQQKASLVHAHTYGYIMYMGLAYLFLLTWTIVFFVYFFTSSHPDNDICGGWSEYQLAFPVTKLAPWVRASYDVDHPTSIWNSDTKVIWPYIFWLGWLLVLGVVMICTSSRGKPLPHVTAAEVSGALSQTASSATARSKVLDKDPATVQCKRRIGLIVLANILCHIIYGAWALSYHVVWPLSMDWSGRIRQITLVVLGIIWLVQIMLWSSSVTYYGGWWCRSFTVKWTSGQLYKLAKEKDSTSS